MITGFHNYVFAIKAKNLQLKILHSIMDWNKTANIIEQLPKEEKLLLKENLPLEAMKMLMGLNDMLLRWFVMSF